MYSTFIQWKVLAVNVATGPSALKCDNRVEIAPFIAVKLAAYSCATYVWWTTWVVAAIDRSFTIYRLNTPDLVVCLIKVLVVVWHLLIAVVRIEIMGLPKQSSWAANCRLLTILKYTSQSSTNFFMVISNLYQQQSMRCCID